MAITEVVHVTNDEHACHQRFRLMGQMTSATGQPGKALSEGGIEAFYEGGVDHAAMLAEAQSSSDYLFAALHNMSLNRKHLCFACLDNLHDGDLGKGIQLRTTLGSFLSNGPRKALT